MSAPPLDAAEPDAALLDAAARSLGLRLVVRFGSRASGSPMLPRLDSDLDLAILAGDRRVDVLQATSALEGAFTAVNLDLAVLNRADPVLRYEALMFGDFLWGDPDLFAEERARAYRMAADNRAMRRFEARLLKRQTDRLLARRHAPA